MSAPEDDGWRRAVLDRRTAALARARSITAPTTEVMILSVAGERFGLLPREVIAVAALRHATPLPHAPPHVLGVSTFAGAVVPVVHLFSVLGVPLAALSEHGRVVILGEREDAIAVAVNEVTIGSIEPPVIPLPDTASAILRSCAHGVDTQGLVILDGAAILASPLLNIEIATPRAETR